MNYPQLRRELKAKRQQLSPLVSRLYAIKIARLVSNTQLFQRSQHLAFYVASRGEVDPYPLMLRAWKTGKTCYLPVLHPLKHNYLWFVPYWPHDKLITNRYGILEPAVNTHPLRQTWRLDLVFAPLVAFDPHGNRLGMGGGYYDRTFSYLQSHSHLLKPQLMGLAYELQQTDALKPEGWDIKLNAVATEKQIYKFSSGRAILAPSQPDSRC